MRLLTLRRVLVATDLDRQSDHALDTAHRLARAAGASLHVVHVVNPDANQRTGPHDVRAADLVTRSLGDLGIDVDEDHLHIARGTSADEIRALANNLSADVIVLGARVALAGDTSRRPMGGTAYAVVTQAFAPCLVVRRPLRFPLDRVLVPFDLSDTARGALLVGLSWASALRAKTIGDGAPRTHLTALHVATGEADARRSDADDAVARELSALTRHAGSWAGISVHSVTIETGDPVESIVRTAIEESTELLVLGTRGRSAATAERLGSVSAAVVSRLTAPILLVPPAVWRVHGAEPQVHEASESESSRRA